ncbi:hypothetical protein ES703_44801 [subsurface metagenome]
MSCNRLIHVYTSYIPHDGKMAIVIGPGMSQQASGNIGAVNFTRWKGVQVARTTYVPFYTPSGKQMTQRGLMTFVSAQWGTALTPAERQAWEERAADIVVKNRLGIEYKPSGYQLFMKWNIQAQVFSYPINFKPPNGPAPVYVWRVQAEPDPFMSANEVTMEKALTVPVDADGFQIYRAGPYDSGGRRPIRPEYRHLTTVWGTYYYHDYAVTDTKWYWYWCRWFFGVGFVGNWWEVQIQTDFPF